MRNPQGGFLFIVKYKKECPVLDGTVLITADLHGSIDALHRVFERVRTDGARHLIIAGDLCPTDDPAFKILLSQAPSLTLVRGNCDSTYAFSRSRIPYPPTPRPALLAGAYAPGEPRRLLLRALPLRPEERGHHHQRTYPCTTLGDRCIRNHLHQWRIAGPWPLPLGEDLRTLERR